jgi:hypothetical protein
MAQPPLADLIQGQELKSRAQHCWEFLENPIVHRLIEPYMVDVLTNDHLDKALPATWRQAFDGEDAVQVVASATDTILWYVVVTHAVLPLLASAHLSR